MFLWLTTRHTLRFTACQLVLSYFNKLWTTFAIWKIVNKGPRYKTKLINNNAVVWRANRCTLWCVLLLTAQPILGRGTGIFPLMTTCILYVLATQKFTRNWTLIFKSPRYVDWQMPKTIIFVHRILFFNSIQFISKHTTLKSQQYKYK